MKLLRTLKGVFIWEKTFRLEPSQLVFSVSWGDCSFHIHGKFHSGLQRWTFSGSLLLSLVKVDYNYSSFIMTHDSAFILGLSTSKTNPIKAILKFWPIKAFSKNYWAKDFLFAVVVKCGLRDFTELIQTQRRCITSLDKLSSITEKLLVILSHKTCELNFSKAYF